MKRNNFRLSAVAMAVAMILICSSCKKDPTLASLSTSSISLVTRTSASTGGNITSDGGATVSSRGVCWAKIENPTISNSKTNDGNGTGTYTSEITGLDPGTIYFVRAYATNDAGTAYGDQLSLTTNDIQSPVLTTAAISSIASSAAVTGGEITDNGGGAVTQRGVCWATESSPTLQDNYTSDGTGTGSYISTIDGLNPETDYYVRAYAINSAGTSYGNEVSFTSGKVTDADGNEYSTVEIGIQVWLVENLTTTTLNDGTKIKAGTDVPLVTGNTEWSNLSTPGYCWYNNDEETYAAYGPLYNWYAVSSGELCPDGWHVASKSDWTALLQYLIDNGFNYDGSINTPVSENKVAKALAASSGWTTSNNTGAVGNDDYPAKINVTGFTARPGGYRRYDGVFLDAGDYGNWWTSSSYSTELAHYYTIIYNWDQVDYYEWDKRNGYSVRCVKD